MNILITGATAGLGKNAALHLARKGHRVFATGRNERALAALQEEGTDLGLVTVKLDVTDAASITAARAEIERATGGRGVDAIVNNAGYGLAGPLESLPDAEVRAQFETNVFGLLAVTRAFVPHLRANGGGRIVNLSSVAGRMVFPFFGAYHASKYAVEAISDALRMELAPWNIKVSIVEPGSTRSNFADRTIHELRRIGFETSPYAAVLDKAAAIHAQNDKFAEAPEKVTYAVEAALTSRMPRARYAATWNGKFSIHVLRRLPTFVLDRVLRGALGLTRKGVARKANTVEMRKAA